MPADGMVVCHLPFGPTAYFGIHNTVLRHDIGQKKEVRPEQIKEGVDGGVDGKNRWERRCGELMAARLKRHAT